MKFLFACLAAVWLLGFKAAHAQTGATMANPILVTGLSGGNYADARNTAGYGNDYNGQPSEDVFYKITIPVSRSLTVSLCGSAFDTYLHLLNAGGTELTANDDNGPACAGLQSSLTYTVSPGTYYVVVEGYATQSGAYQLALSCSAYTLPTGANMDFPVDIGTLATGASFSETLSNNPANGYLDDIGQPSDDIYYKFTLSSADTVTLSTCGSALSDTYLHLLDVEGVEIAFNDDNGPVCAGLNASIKTYLPAGTYYAVAEGWSTNNGNISFWVNVTGSPGDTTVSNDFGQQIAQVFSHLEKSRVPYGMLREIAFERVNLDNFNGAALVDSNYVAPGDFLSIYQTLAGTRINASAPIFSPSADIDSLAQIVKQPGTVVLSGLYYRYSQFTADAVSSGKISLTGNQVYDQYSAGVWQNPYETNLAFAFTANTADVEGKTQQFSFPANLWLTNDAAAVTSLQFDAGDGLGYRTINPGQTLNVTYADSGKKELQFKLSTTRGEGLYGHAQLYVRLLPSDRCGGCYVSNITSPNTTYGTAIGYMTVKYAHPGQGLRKPFIVAEGFDPDSYLRKDLFYGRVDINDFLTDLNRTGLTTDTGPNLTKAILADYDIVYVDWKDATGDIRMNAQVLEQVIRTVNQIKANAGSSEPNVVLGRSMGGLVSRWALKEMENNSENHQVRLFITEDSPEQGANVPIGVQFAQNHLRKLYMGSSAGQTNELIAFFAGKKSPYDALSLTNRPASRQLLINYINNNDQLNNSAHVAWQNELTTMGYPNGVAGIPFRRIAISDGSACGNLQAVAADGKILTYQGQASTNFLGDLLTGLAVPQFGNLPGLILGGLPGKNTLNVDVSINTTNLNGGNEVYHNYITLTKKLFYLVNITSTVINESKSAPSGMLAYENYAGGTQKVTQLSTLTLNGKWGVHAAIVAAAQDYCYVPVVSALDVGSNSTTLTNNDFLASYVGYAPPPAPKNVPFHNFITLSEDQDHGSTNNESHLTLRPRIGDWLLAELNGGTGTITCPSLCNDMSIAGDGMLCTTNSYSIGNLPPNANVSWTATYGATLSVNNTTHIATLTAYTSGVTTTLTAVVTNNCGDTKTFTKSILVGLPQVTITGPATPCINSFGNLYQVDDVPTATAYHWAVSPSTATISGSGTVGDLIAYQSGEYYISLSVDTECGTVPVAGMTVNAYDCTFGGGGLNSFQAYPNPAGSTLTVTSQGGPQTAQNARQAKSKPLPFTYQVYDQYGKVWLKGTSVKGEGLDTTVSHMPNGTYYIHFIHGKQVIRRQLVIKH